MPKPLTASFYRRDAATVARELIGCVLHTPLHKVRLIETEAYLPANDDACHASHGATPRTLPMFEPGGVLYVYFIYGMYWCSNIVADVRGKGSAVLLRACRGANQDECDRMRGYKGKDFVEGPGRLSSYMGFDGTFTGRSVLRGSPLSVYEDAETDVYRERVIATPRIGIRVATDLLLRFVDADAPHARIAKGTRRLPQSSR